MNPPLDGTHQERRDSMAPSENGNTPSESTATHPAPHFVLCDKDKKPIAKKWESTPPSNSEVKAHVDGDRGLVGVIPGSVDCLVIDVDVDKQGDAPPPDEKGVVAVLETHLGGRPFWTLPTPSGGLHLWYRVPPERAEKEEVGNRKWEAGGYRGDIRCDHGYVILWDKEGFKEIVTGDDDGDVVLDVARRLDAIRPPRKSRTNPATNGHPQSNDYIHPRLDELDFSEGNRNDSLNEGVFRRASWDRPYDDIVQAARAAGLPERDITATVASASRASGAELAQHPERRKKKQNPPPALECAGDESPPRIANVRREFQLGLDLAEMLKDGFRYLDVPREEWLEAGKTHWERSNLDKVRRAAQKGVLPDYCRPYIQAGDNEAAKWLHWLVSAAWRHPGMNEGLREGLAGVLPPAPLSAIPTPTGIYTPTREGIGDPRPFDPARHGHRACTASRPREDDPNSVFDRLVWEWCGQGGRSGRLAAAIHRGRDDRARTPQGAQHHRAGRVREIHLYPVPGDCPGTARHDRQRANFRPARQSQRANRRAHRAATALHLSHRIPRDSDRRRPAQRHFRRRRYEGTPAARARCVRDRYDFAGNSGGSAFPVGRNHNRDV